MSRQAEFSKKTKREAWERSGGLCEASGPAYGLEPGKRCNMPLNNGVIYDHFDPEANSHNASLENCVCACPACNRFKTTKRDIPAISKTVRQRDKNRNIRGRSTFQKRRDPWGKERRAE